MKSLLIVLLLALNAFAALPESLVVNSKLPKDQILRPAGKAADGIQVPAEFESEKEIFSVTQGNWRRIVKLVTYKTPDAPAAFPSKTLTFVCEDVLPVEGSRIKVKRMPWPFKAGKMTFTLKRDAECKLMPFFDILSYRPAE